MKNFTVLFFIAGLVYGSFANAQYGRRMYPPRYRQYHDRRESRPPFTPKVYFNIGYGFPNLDKNELFQFYNYYRGTGNQTGPIHASVDYQFDRSTSVGIMAAYGKVSNPYYNYNSVPGNAPAFYGKLEDLSFMVNLVRYMNVGNVVTPYLKTAVGLSIWNQNYVDQSGNKVLQADNPNMLAYQVAIGARIKLVQNTGIFLEAGYGKYIVSGGLSFRF